MSLYSVNLMWRVWYSLRKSEYTSYRVFLNSYHFILYWSICKLYTSLCLNFNNYFYFPIIILQQLWYVNTLWFPLYPMIIYVLCYVQIDLSGCYGSKKRLIYKVYFINENRVFIALPYAPSVNIITVSCNYKKFKKNIPYINDCSSNF